MSRPREGLRLLLIAISIAAGLLLLEMTDVDSSRRLLVGAALVVNVLLLVGRRALLNRPARVGAWASFVGYAGTVIFSLVLALGCGIEYFNATCDAVVTPFIWTFVIVSVVGLPIGRSCGALVRVTPRGTPHK